MRRFVLSLSILMVLSVSVFLVGWVSLRVPAGSYAVYSSKTGGVDTRVVAPGEFWWNAGMLLPTNVRLIVL
ncbi:MAG: hypothetical protein JXM71_03115, partial [Spirochaetales bacterium]|nr:hypothetical protein [Spirochaetales bacterium]